MAGMGENDSTGFIIFRRFQGNVEFLVMHASYDKDLWAPPKGHIEPGETELETAYREVEEEAGLKANHIKIVEGFQKTLRYPVRGKPKRVEYWLAELLHPTTPVKLSDEHLEYKWLTLSGAALICQKFPDIVKSYEEAHDFIKSKELM